MTLNARYITDISLEQYFVNKNDGTPLADGTVEFWQDDNRNVPKLVYQLSGAPPNYTYTALPDPITLSGVGTIEDNSGANVALYYYPYDANGDVQLYYIVVRDSNGVVQFTREAWPNLTTESNPVAVQNSPIVNQLSNPQFTDVLFDSTLGLSIPVTSGITDVLIAPDWNLQIDATGSATITVARNAIAGSTHYPTNPPYALSITGAANVSSLKLIQRLQHNPDIWSPAPGADDGWVATNILLEGSSAVTVEYVTSQAVSQTILTATNNTGSYAEYSDVVQLDPAANADTGATGYVDIVIDLVDTNGTTIFSSVQVVGLQSEQEGIEFNQTPVNRQQDQLFHYYSQPLQAKPIESYLVGWDFPLNPAQALGSTVAAFGTGANKSNYVWDQTICFQTANSAVSFSRPSNQALRVTGAATTQFALIQYLDLPTARQLLNNRLAVNVSALTSVALGVAGNISIWYTDNASVPDMTTNTSVVSTLGTTGKPATVAAGWTEVPRVGFSAANFTVGVSNNTEFNDYSFYGWDLNGIAAVNTAKYVAIVVGFSSITTSDYIDFNSISLVPGDIATRPAPKTAGEVLFDCQRYYESSYPYGFGAGSVTAAGCLSRPQGYTLKDAGNHYNGLPTAFGIEYHSEKRSSSPIFTLYSDQNGSSGTVFGHMFKTETPSSTSANVTVSSYWVLYSSSSKSISYDPNSKGDMGLVINQTDTVFLPSTWITFHYTVDARLGIV